MTAFFGMTSKFVEVTLSHKYRSQVEDGSMAGGPMYYMEKGLNAKWLAIIFAIATVLSSFGTGNLPPINPALRVPFLSIRLSRPVCCRFCWPW